MSKVGIILTPDTRSKAYLQKIINNKINLDKIIFLDDKRPEKEINDNISIESKKCGFDITQSVNDTLLQNNIKAVKFNFVDINHLKLIEFIKNSKIDFFIFTGGGILKKEILNCKSKFIHFHPGIVPEYRGSTCFYYSILNENNCGVTCFIMDENLDTGDIIYQKIFEKPSHEYIDNVYDAHIRSESMLELFKKKLLESKNFKKQNKKGNTYFIIHPVLKHIAILSCILDSKK
jgi:methionyl-tRNA formyltransferase